MNQGSDAADRRRVVLSPHFDDAVFSAWNVLTSPFDVRVVTVFAAVPPPGFVTPLDRRGGAGESAERIRKRREDDRAALAAAGREPIHVGLLDAQYRAERIAGLRAAIETDPARFIELTAADRRMEIGFDELWPELREFVDGQAIKYVPAGIGSHPDHRALARFGLGLARRRHDVRLYADNPYYLRYGVPSWLSRRPNDRADAYVDSQLAAVAEPDLSFTRHVVSFEPPQVAEKLRAARLYETEFDHANADFGGIMTDDKAMRFEVYWHVMAGSHAAPRS